MKKTLFNFKSKDIKKLKCPRNILGGKGLNLAEMGKFAEEQGIDIKKHTKELPENKYKDFKFSQKHEVLESGKVRSTYKLTPPKKTTKKKEEDK